MRISQYKNTWIATRLRISSSLKNRGKRLSACRPSRAKSAEAWYLYILMNYHVTGGKKLSGDVVTNISKNAAVALLCASLLNKGKTTLKRMPRIEEVKRLIEVLESIGVDVAWHEDGDIVLTPGTIDLSNINRSAADRTRSIAMFIAPLAHLLGSFDLPAPSGCDLGKRSLGAHIDA